MISKAPDRPHEVVAAAAELVVVSVGVTEIKLSVIVDDGGALATWLLAAGAVLGVAGNEVSSGPGQSQVPKDNTNKQD